MNELEQRLSDPARTAARTTGDPAVTRAFAIDAAVSLRGDKCEDVVVLDVRELSPVTDYIVIGTGTSDRQMKAALAHVADVGEERGFKRFGAHADERATWLLADFIDVVVHLFEPNARAHYDLEMLWGDAARLPVPEPKRHDGTKAGGA